MANGTVVPLIPVCSRVYWEECIVHSKFCRFPPGVCTMALQTIRGNADDIMIGIPGIVIISPVAGNTSRRDIGIVTFGMTGPAVIYFMALGKRK